MKVSLVGFGMSNKAVLKRLNCNSDYEFFVSDRRKLTEEELQFLKKECVCFEEEHTEKILESELIVPSPGISPLTEVGKMILKSNVPKKSDVSFYFEIFNKGEVFTVGVTGTNGKTTTVSLFEHVLKSIEKNCMSAGNNEYPIFKVELDSLEFLILELSSFQLFWSDNIPLDVGVFLNVESDHLDWHGTFENYFSSKKKILEFSKIKVAGDSLKSLLNLKGLRYFSTSVINEGKLPEQLKSVQNTANLSAVYEVLVNILNVVDEKDFYDALWNFKVPNHRMELVAEINGVKFYDDSKATNTHAVINALKNFKRVTLILSGIVKEKELESFVEIVNQKTDAVILLGAAIKKAFEGLISDYVFVTNMKEAVREAYKRTESGIVLLSPAGASFDMYKNYKERGKDFIRVVEELKDEV